MAQDEPGADAPKKKGGGVRTLAAVAILAMASAGGTYVATREGLLPIPGAVTADEADGPREAIAYVAMPAVIVPITLVGERLTLRVAAQIEVAPVDREAVEDAMPRIVDAANAYLRAVDPTLLEGPSAHVRVKGQLLRRVRLIAGEDTVSDLLLTEMVTI